MEVGFMSFGGSHLPAHPSFLSDCLPAATVFPRHKKKSRHLAECCGLHPKFPIGSCLKTWSPACGAVWYGYGISRKWSLLWWRKWVTGHRS